MTAVKDISQADILNACIKFCYNFAAPALTDEMHVLDGFGNNRTLPKDGNDFALSPRFVSPEAAQTLIAGSLTAMR